jgi:hypothetical protein
MLDNIDVDSSTGDLYIASHPITYKITDSVLNVFGFAFPSQVFYTISPLSYRPI